MPGSNDEKEIYKPVERLWNKLRVDNLWIWILKLLMEKPMYAYEMKSEIKERFNFEPATVTNYAVLYRLERSGFVQEANNTLAPNRKYYEVTEKGMDALDQARQILNGTYEEIFDDMPDEPQYDENDLVED